MLGAGYGCRHSRQNASAHRMTSAAVEMNDTECGLHQITACRYPGELSDDELKIALDGAEIRPRLIGLLQC
jgi:hypothetical protein